MGGPEPAKVAAPPAAWQQLPAAWPPMAVSASWSATDAVTGFSPLAIPHAALAPLWQLLLAGDGSPTRLLSILTGRVTSVDVLDVVELDAAAAGAADGGVPAEVAALAPPLVRRRVVMRAGDGPPLMYAVSWWNAADYAARMPDPSLPIGRSMDTGRAEVHRTLHGVYAGAGGDRLRALFLGDGDGAGGGGASGGQLWARHYTLMHRGGAPLSVIGEVFSPRLAEYLGPQQQQQQRLPLPPAAAAVATPASGSECAACACAGGSCGSDVDRVTADPQQQQKQHGGCSNCCCCCSARSSHQAGHAPLGAPGQTT
jgi:chorismate lyase